MKKTIITVILVAVVIGAGAFFGGMKYGQSKSLTPQSFQNLTPQQRQQMFANAGGTRTGARNGQGAGGGFSAGQVIAKDDKSITIKMQDGSSKIVFYSGSTTIQKSVDGTASDLEVGQNVSTTGAANSDGSETALNIQIRPAGQNPNPGGNPNN
jgi:hypothetical protein